ncbi:MAG: clan AA aspartic protease [Candidatus Coatesbacteria bacterium]
MPITLEGKKRRLNVTALVDTGASLTVIPRQVARQLALVPFRDVMVEMADGRSRRMPVAQVLVRVDGRSAPASVFISTGNEVLLGAEALELLDITVDPKRRRLKMGKHYGLKAA